MESACPASSRTTTGTTPAFEKAFHQIHYFSPRNFIFMSTGQASCQRISFFTRPQPLAAVSAAVSARPGQGKATVNGDALAR